MDASFNEYHASMGNAVFAPNPAMSMGANPLTLDTSFSSAYNMSMAYQNSMPVSDMSNMHHPSMWHANVDYMPVVAAPATHMRNNSLSTMSSSPIVKSEERSPVQPTHMFYEPLADASQLGSSSPVDSDSSPVASFSTDVDTLMKAIQAKTKPAEQQKPKVNRTQVDFW